MARRRECRDIERASMRPADRFHGVADGVDNDDDECRDAGENDAD